MGKQNTVVLKFSQSVSYISKCINCIRKCNPQWLTDFQSSHEPHRGQGAGRAAADPVVPVRSGQVVLEGGHHAHVVDAEEAAAAEADVQVLWIDLDGGGPRHATLLLDLLLLLLLLSAMLLFLLLHELLL